MISKFRSVGSNPISVVFNNFNFDGTFLLFTQFNQLISPIAYLNDTFLEPNEFLFIKVKPVVE